MIEKARQGFSFFKNISIFINRVHLISYNNQCYANAWHMILYV